jgi:EAL domain-containing protein (putative c-di-GMP-specific phosphodiesterase class I)
VTVIAEGVETERQLDRLRSLGCARPLPAEAVTGLPGTLAGR